jgi:hypothetical protein
MVSRRSFLTLGAAALAGEVGRRYFDMGAAWATHATRFDQGYARLRELMLKEEGRFLAQMSPELIDKLWPSTDADLAEGRGLWVPAALAARDGNRKRQPSETFTLPGVFALNAITLRPTPYLKEFVVI